MDTIGRHVLADYEGCDPRTLGNPRAIMRLLRKAAKAAKATVVRAIVTQSPVGVTAMLVIEESHLSIHTNVEEGRAIADFYTCGACEPERACEVLAGGLQSQRYQKMMFTRGLLDQPVTMRLTKPPEIVYCGNETSTVLAQVSG